ncbi:claudin domain-containing protein 2-like [Dermochelys coriacea]|uniref:claudin domain-containing protein 2-like n=1 Tax=Dermochelys coriacea TaxID=27794 RepID=UPI001CA859CD|nr:claudin domain-containing protein 2-like [Dermochelys coriacea]
MGTQQGTGNSPGGWDEPGPGAAGPQGRSSGGPQGVQRSGGDRTSSHSPPAFLLPPPAYVGVSRGCLVLAVLAGYLSVLSGALALAPGPAPRRLDWARGAAALCFLTGTLAMVALGCFMGGSAGEAGGSWAWSLAVGWAAVPAAGLAGTCHCQARRRERRRHSDPRGSPGSA